MPVVAEEASRCEAVGGGSGSRPRALWLPGTLVSVDAVAGGRAVGEDAADEASDEAAPCCR